MAVVIPSIVVELVREINKYVKMINPDLKVEIRVMDGREWIKKNMGTSHQQEED
jgi:hypothetical protein